MQRHHRRLAPFVALAFTSPIAARAQVRASELASVSQTIDGTKLTVNYSRPRVRGRDTLFGNPKVVRWSEVWTPGANFATTLEVSRDIKLDGHPVPKGTYSVWMVVRPTREWTFVLDPKAKRFHMNPPDTTATPIRFPVHADSAAFTEVLTWSFPAVRANGGSLAMQWGTTRVAIDVAVEPSLRVELAESEAAPYLGRYEYRESQPSGPPKRSELVVTYDKGVLQAEWDPADEYLKRFALIRVAPDWFAPGVYDDKGEIYEVLRPDMTIEFTKVGGRATSFEMRGGDDKVWGSGKRKR
jgi:hypothetical protein